jgi:hypothetical protein
MKCGLYFAMEYEFNNKDLGKFFFKKWANKKLLGWEWGKGVYVY